MTHPSGPVLELVAFKVHAPDAFPEVGQQAHRVLSSLDGCCESLQLADLSQDLFADLVIWTSLEAAQDASRVVAEDPRFAALRANIAELRLYAHYQLGAEPGVLFEALRAAPVIEIAAYGVRDIAAQQEVHPLLHEALRGMSGHKGGAPAQQLEDPSQFADVICWGDLEAQALASDAMMARAELAPFLAGMEEMKLYHLFTVLR
jgi:hypothetical protein